MIDSKRPSTRSRPLQPRLRASGRARRPLGPDQELAAIAKALGHPARVLILRHLLRETECLCGELCVQLPLAQSTVSQHLKVLKSAGLIQGTIAHPRVCYCANPARLHELAALLEELLSHDSRAARPRCQADANRPGPRGGRSTR